jgi:hypothetical protein
MKLSELQILASGPTDSRISRRELAKILLAAAPALAFPAVSSAHPIWRHLADSDFLDSTEAQLASPNWKPISLSPAQEASFRALAELTVPGSTKALVSRFVDLLLSVEDHTTQQKFLGSLSAFDAESSAKFGKPFARLAPQEQESLLVSISSAPRSGDASSIMRDHFEDLKQWIAGAYYSSEIGMRELGWTSDRAFSSFPGCSHPEGHP